MLYYDGIVPWSTNQTKLIQTNILMQNQRFLTHKALLRIYMWNYYTGLF